MVGRLQTHREDRGQGPMTSPKDALVLAPEAWLDAEGAGCEKVGGFLEEVSCSWVAV